MVKTTRSTVFLQKPELDYLKLEFAHRADDLHTALLLHKKLGHAFIRKLPDSFFELLGFERIFVDVFLEDLR